MRVKATGRSSSERIANIAAQAAIRVGELDAGARLVVAKREGRTKLFVAVLAILVGIFGWKNMSAPLGVPSQAFDSPPQEAHDHRTMHPAGDELPGATGQVDSAASERVTDRGLSSGTHELADAEGAVPTAAGSQNTAVHHPPSSADFPVQESVLQNGPEQARPDPVPDAEELDRVLGRYFPNDPRSHSVFVTPRSVVSGLLNAVRSEVIAGDPEATRSLAIFIAGEPKRDSLLPLSRYAETVVRRTPPVTGGPTIRLGAAVLLGMVGDAEGAIRQSGIAVREHPESPDCVVMHAGLLLRHGHEAAAEQCLRQAIENAVFSPRARTMLRNAYGNLLTTTNRSGAIQYYTTALTDARKWGWIPEQYILSHNLANALINAGVTAPTQIEGVMYDAEQLLLTAIDLGIYDNAAQRTTQDAEVYRELVRLYRRRWKDGDREAAERALNRAMAISAAWPDQTQDAANQVSAALLYEKMEQFELAGNSYMAAGNAYRSFKMPRDAAEAFANAMQMYFYADCAEEARNAKLLSMGIFMSDLGDEVSAEFVRDAADELEKQGSAVMMKEPADANQ